VVPDPQHVTLAGLSAPDMLSAHIFASHRANAVRDVWLGGQQRVSQGRHRLHEAAAAAFARERAALLVRR
jgi:formimidoylglutamate deiminase